MCTLRPKLLEDLMSYALWLVECSHPSARCYALYFLNIALCYGAFFRIFTARNGLRYLFNAVSSLPFPFHPIFVSPFIGFPVVQNS